MKMKDKGKSKAVIGENEFLRPKLKLKRKPSISPKDEILSKRFPVPFEFRCQGCKSIVAKGVKLNAIKVLSAKSHIGKIRKYNMKCPCCGYKVVMEKTGDICEVVEGGDRIVNAAKLAEWKRARSKAYLESIGPGLSDEYDDVFEIFNIGVLVGHHTRGRTFRGV